VLNSNIPILYAAKLQTELNICEHSLPHTMWCYSLPAKKAVTAKILFAHCQEVNKNAHLVADPDKIERSWLIGANSIGICGATSTPRWLMEDVATRANEISN